MDRLDWTPELDAKVQELWELGWPALAIADEVGLTKGQISGRTFRKRWVWGAKRVTHAAKPKAALPKLPPTLLDLKPHQCKWPVNDPPRGGEYLFCGERQFNSHPYCEYHAKVGFSGKGTARQAATAAWVHKPMVTG